jgi:WD40 repeat protein
LGEKGYEPLLIKNGLEDKAFSSSSLAFSPDGKYLASCSIGDKRFYLWEVPRLGEKGYKPRFLEWLERVVYFAFSPDSKYLVSSSGGCLESNTLWEVSRLSDKDYQGKRINLDWNGNAPLVFSPDSKRLVGCLEMGWLRDSDRYGITVREVKP